MGDTVEPKNLQEVKEVQRSSLGKLRTLQWAGWIISQCSPSFFLITTEIHQIIWAFQSVAFFLLLQ